MATFFRIITRTTDTEGNSAQESIQVKAGEAFAEIPEVSFAFPAVVSTQIGNSDNPYWSNAQSLGFAFCQVTPSPSEAGTGGFFVQTYYGSGTYPHAPARTFADTLKGDGTTLATDYFFSSRQMSLSDGGGFPTSGFMQSLDVSGLRPAMVISQDTQDDNPEFYTGIRRLNPKRLGARIPDTETVFTAFHHDLTSDSEQLRTIRILQEGVVQDDTIEEDQSNDSSRDDPRGNRIPRTVDGWPAGSFVFPHPYHYCPVYENNNLDSVNVMPYILVVEDGVQYPLRGTASVNGTAVDGQFTKFDTEISGQSVIRFEGSDQWYIVSGILSSSGLVIYDYGENPQFTNVAVQANRYAIGSGLIQVLPNIAGCSTWDIELTPKYNDGDVIPGDSVVYSVGFTGDGAISGTPQYEWVITRWNATTDAFISTSGTGVTTESVLEVPYSQNQRVQVDVQVSGTGQPVCVHTYNTGGQVLTPGANAGTWSPELRQLTNTDGETISSNRWFRREGAGAATDVIHHWRGLARCAAVAIQDSGFTMNDGQGVIYGNGVANFSSWPDQGAFVIYAKKKTDDGSGDYKFGINYYGTYSGKSTNSLTGCRYYQRWRVTDQRWENPENITARNLSIGSNYSSSVAYWAPNHWPMTYVVGISSDRTKIKVEDARKILNARNTGRKFWVIPNQLPDYWTASPPVIVPELTGFSLTTDEIEFSFALPNYINVGDAVVPALFDHWRNGPNSRVDTVPEKNWNLWQQSLYIVTDYLTEGDGSGTSRVDAASWEIDVDDTFAMHVFTPLVTTALRTSLYENSLVYFSFQRVAKKGRIMVVDQNREKLVTIEYEDANGFSRGDLDPSQAGGQNEYGSILKNCRIVQAKCGDEAITAGKITLRKGQIAFPYKEMTPSPDWVIDSRPATDPHFEMNMPGVRPVVPLANSHWYDLVQANLSGTEGQTGLLGELKSKPIWEEQIIPGWPVGAIPATDSIFIDTPDALPPEDPVDNDPWWWWRWFCVDENEMVTVSGAGQKPIGEVQAGDYVLADPTPGYYQVLDVQTKSVENGAVTVEFENGESLSCTGGHRIGKVVPNGVEWTPAVELQAGDPVLTTDGETTVASVVPREGTFNYVQLFVEETHTYYVGSVLTHNYKTRPWQY